MINSGNTYNKSRFGDYWHHWSVSNSKTCTFYYNFTFCTFLIMKHKYQFINWEKFIQTRKYWLFILFDPDEWNDILFRNIAKDKLFIKHFHLCYVLLLWKDSLGQNHYNKLFANESVFYDMVIYWLR